MSIYDLNCLFKRENAIFQGINMKKNSQNGEKINIFERIRSFFSRKKNVDKIAKEEILPKNVSENVRPISNEIGESLPESTSESLSVVESSYEETQYCNSDLSDNTDYKGNSEDYLKVDSLNSNDTDSTNPVSTEIDDISDKETTKNKENAISRTDYSSDKKTAETITDGEGDNVVTTLTPQQEYVACRNINVTVSETLVRSFIAKLCVIDSELQEYYSELKNYALSFSGTRYRTSWQYDSIYKTKILLARFVIKGKSLWIYVTVTPEEVPEGTNFVTTKDKKYEGLHVGLKVQGTRTLKQAKTLLRIACEKEGLVYVARKEENFIPEPSSDEELLEKGLIKKVISSTNPQ